MKTPGIRRTIQQGFSLMEMLVVLSIILILLGFGVNSLQDSGSSFEVFSTVRSCAALFEDARESALKFSNETKILVHNDPAQPENFGRIIQVIRRFPPDAPGEDESWRAYQNPFVFSEGVFYSPALSTSNEALAPEAFDFNGSSWLAYSVSRRGYYKNFGALFVLVPGSRDFEGKIVGPESLRGGFMIQRRGRPVVLSDTQLAEGNE